jgi:hypothetical protein
MDAVERAAYLSIGRACGFGALAIFTFMVGLSFEPVLAARAGGVLTLVMVAVLVWSSLTAMTWPYKRTETWLILELDERPPEREAQRIIGGVLKEAYGWYARSTAIVSIVLLASALLLSFQP